MLSHFRRICHISRTYEFVPHSDAETWLYRPTSFSLHLLPDQPPIQSSNTASVFRDWQNPENLKSRQSVRKPIFYKTAPSKYKAGILSTRPRSVIHVTMPGETTINRLISDIILLLKNCNLPSNNVPLSTLQRRRTGRIPHFTWLVVRPAFLLRTSHNTRLSSLTCVRVSDVTLHA
jgi:hypothetical protein